MTRSTTLLLCRTALSAFLLSSVTAAYAQAPSDAASVATNAPLPFFIAAANPGGIDGTASAAMSSSSSPVAEPNAPDSAAAPVAELPDAPSSTSLHAALPDEFIFLPPGQASPNVAPRLTKYIPAGYTGQSLTAHDKVLLGLHDLYSPLNFVAMIASAGYEQVLNGEPNYGTDRGAFGQRLGAAAIRESSQGFLTDSVFSPIFHEDPRYYIQGVGHSFFYRLAYAATRPFITRTDSGNSTINAALLTGYAGSAALSYTYYPQINRNFHDTVSTFGGSLGGAALGYAVSEFSDDVFKALHLKKK